jgi:hypothetical protein
MVVLVHAKAPLCVIWRESKLFKLFEDILLEITHFKISSARSVLFLLADAEPRQLTQGSRC